MDGFGRGGHDLATEWGVDCREAGWKEGNKRRLVCEFRQELKVAWLILSMRKMEKAVTFWVHSKGDAWRICQ